MKLRLQYKTFIFTGICFASYLILMQYFQIFKERLDEFTQNGLVSYILTYFVFGIPIFLGTYLINPKISVVRSLGLLHNPLKPLLIAIMFSLPMFIGGLLFFEINSAISIPNMIAGSIVIGLVEESFYRGFLFGQIYRHTPLGFVSAILVGAIIFASGHMYQSQDILELAGIFSVTFMGAVLFAWLFVEWNYNLWIPVFLHALMNLSWYLYDMSETAMGGMLPNIFRGLTIAFAIIFTLIYKKRRSLPITITKDKLFSKHFSDS
jgi:membrane protease YdiL (CAAX protease family)